MKAAALKSRMQWRHSSCKIKVETTKCSWTNLSLRSSRCTFKVNTEEVSRQRSHVLA